MKRTISYIVLALALTVGLNFAQSKKQLSENEVQNLVAGINSENEGLQRSSIFMAGYYKIEEVVDELRNEMLYSENANIQVLSALALFEIGNDDVLEDLNTLSKNSSEELKVRRMATAIYDHWVQQKVDFVSVVQ